MNLSLLKNRTIVEILSITGVMALFTYMDIRIGLLQLVVDEITRVAPDSSGMLITIVGSLWVGLLTFSYYRRLQLKQAVDVRKILEARLAKKNLVNEITGLPNQAGFESILNQSLLLLEHPYWSVLAIKIANIASIRNIHGVDVSAAVEVQVAESIKKVATTGQFVAHGEPSVFYLVAVAESEDEVAFQIDSIADSLSLCLDAGVEVDGKILNIQTKFAVLNRKPAFDKILRYEQGSIAKRLGYALQNSSGSSLANIVTYNDEMETALQRRATIEISLRSAIRDRQIVPYYQPFIDFKSNQVIGFEILARWDHPVEGMLMPSEFVPVAEEQGELGELTLSILEQACEAAKDWPEHIMMALNVSPNDLLNCSIVVKMIKIMRDQGFDPHRVELEITENAFIAEAANVSDAIKIIKEEGISISIDDFGTGYSSLHHLRLLPFDKIKIDQSFVRDIATNPNSRAIVQNIIALGKSLGLPTIAEGVDDKNNHNVLEELDCAIGQGYLYAQPLKSSEISGFLAKYSEVTKLVVAA